MNNDNRYMLLAFRITADLGVSIAAPVVVFSYLGKWLDDKYGTAPWLLLASFVISASLSGLIVYMKAKAYAKEYRDLDRKDPPPTE